MGVLALTSSPDKTTTLRRLGAVPLVGDLDQPATLRRLAGLATHVLHLAPPPSDGWPQVSKDPRTLALLRALSLRARPQVVVYGSTSGVYGDCGGDRVAESRPMRPQSARAQRRADAEAALRWFGLATGARVATLRIPGIYGPDREGGTPRARLQRATAVLRREDDVFTNHIHADDLARACVLALWRAPAQRVYNICDDTELRMGDYYDLAADLYGLPRPPRVSRDQASATLPLGMLSFMNESRRLDNARMKQELRLRLRWPTVAEGLRG